MEYKSIQIIGTQRSGSNLFRLMLNQLDDVVAPHPPHILKNFVPLVPFYGNLSVEENFEALINDVCKLIELNPVPWKNMVLDRDQIKNRCKNNTLMDVFLAIYELKAETFSAKYWCCKSMYNVHYFEELEEMGHNPCYIHLYRDGRDVALSFRNAIVGQKHYYHIAKQWKQEQELSIGVVKKLGPSRAIQVSYENLLREPEMVMQKVCEFIQVKFNPKVMNYYASEESKIAAHSGGMWQNLSKPIMSENYNKYKQLMSLEDIGIFETVAGDVLETLGYTLENSISKNGQFTAEQINQFDKINEELKNKAIQSFSTDAYNRAGQVNHLNEIKLRGAAPE